MSAVRQGHTTTVSEPFCQVVGDPGADSDQVARHTLRHPAITHLVQTGVDLPTVERTSGHKPSRSRPSNASCARPGATGAAPQERRTRTSAPGAVSSHGGESALELGYHLSGDHRQRSFDLYLIMDVFGRKTVGWEVFDRGCAEHGAAVFHKAHLCEGIGVVPSFTRPSRASIPLAGGSVDSSTGTTRNTTTVP